MSKNLINVVNRLEDLRADDYQPQVKMMKRQDERKTGRKPRTVRYDRYRDL